MERLWSRIPNKTIDYLTTEIYPDVVGRRLTKRLGSSFSSKKPAIHVAIQGTFKSYIIKNIFGYISIPVFLAAPLKNP